MTHIELRHTVRGEIVSTDSTLLDQIESVLPSENGVTLGDEYNIDRNSVGLEDGTERIVARMTFAPDGDEFADDSNGVPKKVVDSDAGEDEILRSNVSDSDIYGPSEAAASLFSTVESSDLANKADRWELRHERSPQGGVIYEDLRKWYAEDESRQPTDEDGDSYIPGEFKTDNHVITETSG